MHNMAHSGMWPHWFGLKTSLDSSKPALTFTLSLFLKIWLHISTADATTNCITLPYTCRNRDCRPHRCAGWMVLLVFRRWLGLPAAELRVAPFILCVFGRPVSAGACCGEPPGFVSSNITNTCTQTHTHTQTHAHTNAWIWAHEIIFLRTHCC